MLADPMPRVLSWLAGHEAMVAALGPGERVGPYNRPPYPRLRVLDTGGDDRALVWLSGTDVQIEAYGDLDGAPGKAELRRLLYLAFGVLMELPEQPGGSPVISGVRSLRAGAWSPEPTGQPCYRGAVRVMSHP